MLQRSILFFVIAIIAAVAGLDALSKPSRRNHPAPVRPVPVPDHRPAFSSRDS